MKYEPLKFKFLSDDKYLYLNRPTKYSVKKLEEKSVKQKNLFEVRRFSVGVSYFSVAMNNNFRNILSALIFWYFSIKRKVQYISFDLVAARQLSGSNAPLILTTPHKIEDFHGDIGDQKQLLPRNMVNDIYELMLHINSFIDGEREQLNLFKRNAV